MATEVGKLYYDLSIDDSKLKRGLDSADNSVENTGSKFAGLGKAVATGAAVAGAAVVAFGVSSVKAFSESQDAIAQTEAVLKSTAGAAGVTAEMVDNLSSSIQNNSKFSDEQVRSAQNMLLTFTKIGKDVFPEATLAVADMAQAMGQDLTQTSIQVGKALQDPVQGVTALQRVGVRLTEDQKKLVEQMVKTGDVAGAQRLILKELATEFGGSAEAAGKTFSGQLEKAKNKLNDLQEAIGGAIVKGLQPLVAGFNEWFDSAGGVEGITTKAKQAFDNLKLALENLRPVAEIFSMMWRNVFGPALEAILTTMETRIIPAFERLKEKLDPIMPGIMVLGAALLVLSFGPFAALAAVITASSYVISLLIGWIANLIGWIGNVGGVIFNATRAMAGAFQWAYEKIKGWWSSLPDDLRKAVGKITDIIYFPFKTAFNLIAKAWNNTVGKISFKAPDWIPGGLGGKQWSVPKIPEFKKGVENFEGGLAFVHKNEALVNLSPGTSVIKASEVQGMTGGGRMNISIGTINNQQDADYLIQRINRSYELAGFGISPVGN
jgi:hypothetical protein